MSIPGCFSCSCIEACASGGDWRRCCSRRTTHSLHHLFKRPVETGLDMAGESPSVQPWGGLTCCLPQSASSSFWAALSLCGHGAKRLDCQRASFPADPGSHQAGRWELVLGPPQARGSLPQRGSLCAQPSSGEGELRHEFTAQCLDL